VGIGTDSPMVALNVHDSTNARIALTNSSTGQTFPDGFELLATGLDAYLQNRSNGNMIFTTNNAERMRIDSSGQITNTMSGGEFLTDTSGHITSFQTLDVATAGGRFTGKSNRGTLGFIRIEQTTTGADGGYISFDTSPNGSTTPAERMRIDSSGNVLVGHTSAEGDSSGTTLYQNGQTVHKADGAYALELVRSTSDGDILTFRKDGSSVGSIGVFSSDLYIGTNDSGLRFEFAGTNAIVPFDVNSVATSDNATDLGASNARFKDLYLGGSVGIGGTSIGAKLEITGTDTEPLTVLNNTVYTFAGNVTTSQSNTHTVTIPFTSQASEWGNFIVEIYASLSWASGSSQPFAGRALYTFNTLNSISTISELEDVNNSNLSFSATDSGMNFIVTITTTAAGGQEPDRIGVMAKLIRSNGSVGNEPTSMTIA